MDAGAKALKKYGIVLQEEVIESIKKNKVASKGPVGTPVGEGFTSVKMACA